MRKRLLVSLAALATAAATATVTAVPANAAGRDPLVIQGIGPGDIEADARPAQPHRASRAARRARPRHVQTHVATASTRGQYGGGFIEFLITGGAEPAASPPPRQDYRKPSRRAARYRSVIVDEPSRRPARRYQQQAFAEPEPSFRRNLPKVVAPKYQRQEVAYASKHGRGTIVVDTPNRFLYYVLGNGRAMRYGIGVGRPGFEWSGVKKITRKAEWPAWRPPSEMLKRRPDLPKFMAGGPSNPLGARAMYLGSSLYRIHGTNEPNTIGTNVSSGCIRLLNKDVIDLYQRARVGARVIVI